MQTGRHWTKLLQGVLFAYLTWVVSAQVNPITIDNFTAGNVLLSVTPATKYVDYFTYDNETILGNERDIELFINNGPPSSVMTCAITTGQVSMVSPVSTTCGITFQWDGEDENGAWNTEGFEVPINFHQGGSTAIQVRIQVEHSCTGTIWIESESASCSINFNMVSQESEYILYFNDFEEENVPCDFGAVIGVELDIMFTNANQANLFYIGTYAEAEQSGNYIDQFTERTDIVKSITSSTAIPVYYQSFTECCSSSMLGGQRDSYVFVSALSVPSSHVSFRIYDHNWNIIVGDGVSGVAEVQYDGGDTSLSVNPYGLGNIDLTGAGQYDTFHLQVISNRTTTGSISVYSGASHYQVGRAGFFIPASQDGAGVNIDFDSFSPNVFWTSVGAIEVSITLIENSETTVRSMILANSRDLSIYPSPSTTPSITQSPTSAPSASSTRTPTPTSTLSPEASASKTPSKSTTRSRSSTPSLVPSASSTPSVVPENAVIDFLTETCDADIDLTIPAEGAPPSISQYTVCHGYWIMGNERDILLNITEAPANHILTSTVSGGFWVVYTNGAVGSLTLQYDGPDQSPYLNGFAAYDFTQGGVYVGIHFTMSSSHQVPLQMKVRDSTLKQCSYGISAIGGNVEVGYRAVFAHFFTSTIQKCDFSSIISFEFVVDFESDLYFRLSNLFLV